MRAKAGILSIGLALAPGILLACPTCKDAFELDPLAQGFGRGIYYSVIFMLGMLALMVGFIVRMMLRESRSSEAARAGQKSAPSTGA